MNSMGVTNAHWGVCGFTSSFYAMYEMNQSKRPQPIGAGIATRVLAEIKTYLNILKAAGKTDLLNDITKFTQSFGGDFKKFTIDKYITRVDSAVSKTEDKIKADPNYGIAMPPHCVADYLKRIWEYDSTVEAVAPGASFGNGDGIIGVTAHDMPLYFGLCHYLYRLNNKIYSWGQTFNSVTDAANGGAGGANWVVCYFITIQPK